MHKKRLPRLSKAKLAAHAETVYKRQVWSKKRKRWLYTYLVYPPPDKPFLPSDEALKTMVGKVPGVGFTKSERLPDRDFFLVFGLKRNIFSRRADLTARIIRRQFLLDVGNGSSAERDLGKLTLETSESFCRENECQKIEWTGRIIIATTNNKRWESHMGGRCKPPFKELYRVCKQELPFSYEAAQ